MKHTKHGLEIMFNPVKDCTSRAMRGEMLLVKIRVA